MARSRTLVVLGCGSSVGVPMIGCECGVCTSPDPKNSRTRPSVLLHLPGGNLLVDTGPELRGQLVRERIGTVDAVLYTHHHADHLFGLDDVRIFPWRQNRPMPVYCTDEVEEVIRQAFGYAFRPPAGGLVLPQLDLRRIDRRPFELLGETVTPIPLLHGRFNVFGFRVGNLAYCTDVNRIPDDSWPLLAGLDTLILGCLRPAEFHPSHFILDDALGVVERVKPKRTFFTHLGHEWDYDHRPCLPSGVALAHDGLRIEF